MLIGLLVSLGFSFQPSCPAPQRSQARLEFRLLNQALRVAVDQPLERAVGLSQLTVEGIEFEPMRRGLHGVQAPLILCDNLCRIVEQPADFGPHRLVEQLRGDQPGIAPERTVEAAPVRAATAIVAPMPAMVMAGEPIAALLADQQAAQQILDARKPLAIALAAGLQLLGDTREEVFVDNRWHRDADVPLSRGEHLPPWPSRQAIVAAWRMQRRPPRHTLAPTIKRLSRIGRVEQHAMDHRPAPVSPPSRAWKSAVVQAPADPG